MSSTTHIPLPAGLPAPWERSVDELAFWTMDRMHFPYPLTKIDEAMVRMIYGPGINHGFSTYDMPVRADSRRFWSHAYISIMPLLLPDEEVAAMGKRSEEKFGATMGQLMERWETVWLPEITQLLADWERFDLRAASTSELLVHLDETMRRFQHIWTLHFEIVFAAQLPVSLFDEFYRDLFVSENAFAAYDLVQGFENLTVRVGSDLWKLGRKALASPTVHAILEECAASDVMEALEASADGPAFLEELRAYLEEHGRRGGSWGLSYPSWIEDPLPVIKNLKDYISQPDRDPDLELAGLAAQRDQLIAAARERLQSYPEPVRNQFEFLLKAAQDGNVLSEDHNYWIDFCAAYEVRRVFMEFGRRFADAGAIAEPNDIFHLTIEEIRETADQLPSIDRKPLVDERKAEIAHYSAIDLPPAVGTAPPGPPPTNPMSQLLGKFFGTPPRPSGDPNVLNGAAGSAGVVRGTARVVHTLAEADRIHAGDVLVAPTTAPPWTPLFATVAAVVTDTGGVLSHCAVVAREYRIPAVVGTGTATTVIQDGQLIEVDGDHGIVRIISSDVLPSDTAGQTTTNPISASDDFPVAWPNPADAHVFWQAERMHWPDPMTPMDFEFTRDAHDQFSWALASYGVPLQYNARHINYRWYYAVTPSIEDLSEMPARMQAGRQNLEATIPRLRDLWNGEWLPEVQQHLDYWETFDLASATMPALLAHLDETVARHVRVWQIHFLQTFPVYMAMSTFDDLYQDLFGTENGLDAYRLMQGFDNKTVEMGRELWRLSRQALGSPILRAALAETAVANVLPTLEQSDEGRAFLEDFRRFLNVYGRRGEKLGVTFVSWLENPSQAIRQLQDYVRQPYLDPEAAMAKLVAERELALTDARAALNSYPRPVIEQFESMLEYAQQATIISEDHTLYIDFACTYQVRKVLLEFGRRFAKAGVLEDPEDVFVLTRSELRETAERLPHIDRQGIVASRKREMEHFRGIVPPPALGTSPIGPPPDDPLSRTVGKFFGAPPPNLEGSTDELVIRGGAGSSGRAQGIARVILSLSEADRLTEGDILVAPTTAPTWTPLFASAAAVVTDTGGVLSHCAVVAREYRIPAVVGTGTATTAIKDGQLIEVDGDRGIVRIVQTA